MSYAWNWGILLTEPYLGWLVAGFGMTLAISLAAWSLALIAGLMIGVAATLPTRLLRAASAGYVTVFRNIPLLLQLFLWFFVLPELLPASWGHWLKRDLPMPEVVTSVVALGLFTSARVAVQLRAGIEGVPTGQWNAATAGGLTTAQAYRHVILPQALRLIVPPLTSEFLTVFKNSALALTIGVLELTALSRQIEAYTFQGFEAFTAATVLYLLIALAVTGLMRLVERRTRLPGTPFSP